MSSLEIAITAIAGGMAYMVVAGIVFQVAVSRGAAPDLPGSWFAGILWPIVMPWMAGAWIQRRIVQRSIRVAIPRAEVHR